MSLLHSSLIPFIIILPLFIVSPGGLLALDYTESSPTLAARQEGKTYKALDEFLLKNYDKITSGSWENPKDLEAVEELLLRFPTADISYLVLEGLFRSVFSEEKFCVFTEDKRHIHRYRSPIKTLGYLENHLKEARSSEIRLARKIILLKKYILQRVGYALDSRLEREMPLEKMDRRIDELLLELEKDSSGTPHEALIDFLRVRYVRSKSFIARKTGHKSEEFDAYDKALALLKRLQEKYEAAPQLHWFYLEEFAASLLCPREYVMERGGRYTDHLDNLEKLQKRICDNRPPEPRLGNGVYGVRFAARANIAGWYVGFDPAEGLRQYQLMLKEYPGVNDERKAYIYHRISQGYRDMGDYEKALEAVNKSLETDPDSFIIQVSKEYYEDVLAGKRPPRLKPTPAPYPEKKMPSKNAKR